MPHDDLPGSRQSHGVLQHHLRETASTAARTPATLARDWGSRQTKCQQPQWVESRPNPEQETRSLHNDHTSPFLRCH